VGKRSDDYEEIDVWNCWSLSLFLYLSEEWCGLTERGNELFRKGW